MAWTALTFSVGQILTAAQMNNLQSNFTALANGDAGAPLIQDAALDTKIIDGEQVNDMVAGPIYIANAWFDNYAISNTSGDIMVHYMVTRPGTVRAFLGVERTSASNTACIKVLVNSVIVSSEYCWNSPGWNFWEEDITVTQGDILQTLIRSTIGVGQMDGKVSFGVSSSTLIEKFTLVNSTLDSSVIIF